MKTLLSIGVFVAVIFWTSDEIVSLKCWASKGGVILPDVDGTTRDFTCLLKGTGKELTKATEDNLRKANCTQENCILCGRHELVFPTRLITDVLLFCVPEIQKCSKEETTDEWIFGSSTILSQTICKCDRELCNAGECKVEKKDDEIVTCDMGPPPTPKPEDIPLHAIACYGERPG